MLGSIKIRIPKLKISNFKTCRYISPKSLILIELLYVINIQWIIDFCKLPAVITRFDAVIALLLVGWQFEKIVNYIRKRNIFALFFLFYTFTNLIGSLINGFNPIYVLWTFLKNYIFFFFLIACIINLKKEDFCKYMEILCKFHILNFILCMYQYFVLGLQSDYLGGLFGIKQGCNGYQNIYAIVVCCYLIYRYLSGEKIFRFALYLVSFLVIAALADIVGFFVLICICCIIMLVFMSGINKRLKIIGIFICGIIVGINVFQIIYPVRYEYFTNSSNWFKYMGYGSKSSGGIYGISRTNPFSQISERFFHGSILKNLFGLGYGNCSQAESLKLFQSEFYIRNIDYQYYWFSTAYTFIENGICGLLSYLILEIGFLISSVRMLQRKQEKNWGVFCLMISVSYVFIFFYNQSLITSAGYIFYFVLSAIFIKPHNCIMINNSIKK